MGILIKNVRLNNKRRDIFIEGNKIENIGKLNFNAEEKIDGKGKVVLPGFVNCHTHSAMSLFKGYADDFPLKKWLTEKIWPLEEKINEEDVYWGTKLACLEMIKTGTTCFNDMYWYANGAIEVVKEMKIRAVIGLIMADFSPLGSKENVMNAYEKFKNKLPENISLAVAPHAIYTVSEENLIWAKNFANGNNMLLHIHLSESEEEVKNCIAQHKMTPVEYLEKIGFLGENCVLAHSIHINENDIEILAKRKCKVVYNPCSNMKLTSGIFPYRHIPKFRY